MTVGLANNIFHYKITNLNKGEYKLYKCDISVEASTGTN